MRRMVPYLAVYLAVLFTVMLQVSEVEGVPPVSVLTVRYDNARDGLNSAETTLTTSTVNSSSFGKLFNATLDGNVYAQVLYVPGLLVNGGMHNVIYAATENASVYALDADSGAQLWQVNLLPNGSTPVNSNNIGEDSSEPGCVDISPNYGITSTPVIDPLTNTIYVVALSQDGSAQNYRLHALSLFDGSEKFNGPELITATAAGSGAQSNNGTITFDTTQEVQRAGLLLTNSTVYLGFGAHCDLDPWHGWLLGYSASNVTNQVAVYNTTANGMEGGIWMAGVGPAADSNGSLYLATGNGSFDTSGTPPIDASESVLKFTPSLGVLDFFSPSDQMTLTTDDYDLGAGGVALLQNQPSGPSCQALVAGKFATIMLLNCNNLGGFNVGMDDDLAEIPSPNQDTILNWSTASFWNGTAYYIFSKDVLRSYTVSGGNITANQVGTHTYPFLGASTVVSANGTTNGILWAMERKGSTVTAGSGLLHAYNATTLAELYNSDQNGTKDVPGQSVKFTEPTVVNGKVYVGSLTGLDVYGLTGATPTPTASGTPTPTSTVTSTAVPSPTPTTVAVTITGPANNATVSGTTSITVVKGAGTSWVNVYIDGLYFASTPPATMSWNTTTVSNGSHTISANAYSGSSVLLGTASVLVTVSNGGPTPTTTATATGGKTPTATPTVTATITVKTPTATQTATMTVTVARTPTATATSVVRTPTATPTASTVKITTPANNVRVSGMVTITITKASGTWANFYIDGEYLTSTPPQTTTWNSITVANGLHTISAVAFSNANSAAVGSASINVTVAN